MKKGSLPLGPATNEGSRVRDLVDSLKKGDSPRCGEMSRSDKGDGPRQELAVSNANRLRDLIGSLVKGDSPQCGEMSRSDKGDGLPSGAGCERSE